MSNVAVPYYYNQMSAKERSYVEYMGEINKDIGSKIENNAKEINSAIVNAQIATSNAIYNNAQEIKGTLTAGFSGVSSQLQSGFSDVSRQLGVMGSSMTMGFALLNSAVQKSSKAICDKLDNINNTLKNPLYTESRELYNRALQNYNKGLYEEALEDLHEAIKKNKTDASSHFLLGQTYLRGISEFSNVIDLDASIEALKNAAKYITSDAKTYPEVRPMAADIWFCLGLAYHTRANDALHTSNETDHKKFLEEAKTAYGKSWDYSQNMLESLYNLARCEVLFNETDRATRDLITVILKDHGYCIKMYFESDFSNEFKDKLYYKLKKEVYPEVKTTFDRIKVIRTDFQTPYSTELAQLIKMYLPNTFNEDMPPFDMLKASVYFPNILSVLEKEENDCKKQYNTLVQEKRNASTKEKYNDLAVQFRKMNGYKNTAELASECEIQYNLLREEEEKRKREIEEYQEAEERKRSEKLHKEVVHSQIGNVITVLTALIATIMIFFLNHFDIGWNIILVIFLAGLNLIPFLVIFFDEWGSTGKRVVFIGINIIVSMVIFFAYANYEPNVANINTTALKISSAIFAICNVTSCITAIFFPKD